MYLGAQQHVNKHTSKLIMHGERGERRGGEKEEREGRREGDERKERREERSVCPSFHSFQLLFKACADVDAYR